MNEFKNIRDLARSLRKNQTEAEQMLWQLLRNRQLENYKFLRQHPIIYKNENGKRYFFIADFYCAEMGLVVELDGKIHDERKEYDEQRDLIIKEKGFNVIRIKNEELKNVSRVLTKIKK